MSEIDKKVLDALQKEAYEYLIVKDLKLTDKFGEDVKILGP
jgi:hypothetical protein